MRRARRAGGHPPLEVSGTNSATAIRPTATSGTLIRKTEPHQKWSSSQPPRIGPSGSPQRGRGDPDGDRPRPFLRLREQRRQYAHGQRHHERRAQAEQRATGDEHLGPSRPRRTAPRRSRRRPARPAAAFSGRTGLRGSPPAAGRRRAPACRRRRTTGADRWRRAATPRGSARPTFRTVESRPMVSMASARAASAHHRLLSRGFEATTGAGRFDAVMTAPISCEDVQSDSSSQVIVTVNLLTESNEGVSGSGPPVATAGGPAPDCGRRTRTA